MAEPAREREFEPDGCEPTSPTAAAPSVASARPGQQEGVAATRAARGSGKAGSSFRFQLFCGLVAPSASSLSLGADQEDRAAGGARAANQGGPGGASSGVAGKNGRKAPQARSPTTSRACQERQEQGEDEEEEKQSDCCLSLSSFRQQAAATRSPASQARASRRAYKIGPRGRRPSGASAGGDDADTAAPAGRRPRQQQQKVDAAPLDSASCNNLVRMIVDKNAQPAAGDSFELSGARAGSQAASVASGLDEPPEPLILLGGARCPAVVGGSAGHAWRQGAPATCAPGESGEQQAAPQRARVEGGSAGWLGQHKSSGARPAASSTQQQRALEQLVELLGQFASGQQQAKQQQQQQSSVIERPPGPTAPDSDAASQQPTSATADSRAPNHCGQTPAPLCSQEAPGADEQPPGLRPPLLEPLCLEPSWSAFVQLDSSGSSEQQAGQQPGADAPAERAKQRRSNLRFQQDAIWELLTTEAFYLGRLRVIIDLFLASLASLQRQALLLEVDASSIFSNVIEVYEANWQLWTLHLEPMLLAARSTGQPLEPSMMRDAFVQIRRTFSPYYRYCLEHTACLSYVRELSRANELFKVYVAWCESQKDCERLKLMDLLARPMQRLTRYSLLLKAIAKRTDDLEQLGALEQMIAHMDKFVLTVDLELRRKEELERLLASASRIDAFESGQAELNCDEGERFARQFAYFELRAPIFNCPFECRRQLLYDSSAGAAGSLACSLGPIKFKDALAGAKLDVVLLLLTDQLLVCKQTSAAGAGSNSRWPYHHHQPAAAAATGNYAAAGAHSGRQLGSSQQLAVRLASCSSNQDLASLQAAGPGEPAASQRPPHHAGLASCGQQQHLSVGGPSQPSSWQKRASVGGPPAANQLLAAASNNQLLGAAASLNLPTASPDSSSSSLAGHAAREFFVRGAADSNNSGAGQHHAHQPSPAGKPGGEARLRVIRSPYPIERLVVHELRDGQGVFCCQLNDSLTVSNCFILYTCAAGGATATGGGSGEQLAKQARDDCAGTSQANQHHPAGSGAQPAPQQQRSSNYLRAQDSSRSESESLQLGLSFFGSVGGAGGSACSSRRSSDCKRRPQQPPPQQAAALTPAKQLAALIKQAQVRHQLAANFHNVHLTTISGNLILDPEEPACEQQQQAQAQQPPPQQPPHARSRWSSFRHHSRGHSERSASNKSCALPTAPCTPIKQRSTENSKPAGANTSSGSNEPSSGAGAALGGPHKAWSASSENQLPASSATVEEAPPSSRQTSSGASAAGGSSALMKAIVEQHQWMLLNHGLHDELATHDYLYQVLDESYLRVLPVAVGLQSCSASQHRGAAQRQPPAPDLLAPTIDQPSPSSPRLHSGAEPSTAPPSIGAVGSDGARQRQQLSAAPSNTNSTSSSGSSPAKSRPASRRGRQRGLSPHWHSPSTRRRGWHLSETHKVSISASNIQDLLQPAAGQARPACGPQQQLVPPAAPAQQQAAASPSSSPSPSPSPTSHLQLKKSSQRRNLSSLRRQNVILSASSEQAQQLQLQLQLAPAAEGGARPSPSLLLAGHSAAASNSLEGRARGRPPREAQLGELSATFRCDSSAADTTSLSTTTGPSVSSSAPVSSSQQQQWRAPPACQQQQFLSRQRQDGSSQATTMDQMSITLDDSNFDLLLLAEPQLQLLQLQQQQARQCAADGHFAAPLAAPATCGAGVDGGVRATSFELGNLRPRMDRSLAAGETWLAGPRAGAFGSSAGRDEPAHAPRSASMETRSPISVTLTLPNSDVEDNQQQQPRERQHSRQQPSGQSSDGTRTELFSAGAPATFQRRQLSVGSNWCGFPSLLNIRLRMQLDAPADSYSLHSSGSSSAAGRRTSLSPIDSSANSPQRQQLAELQRTLQDIERQIGADRLPVFNVTAASPLNLDGPAYSEDRDDDNNNSCGSRGEARSYEADICDESSVGAFADDSLSAARDGQRGQSISEPADAPRTTTAHLRAHWALRGSGASAYTAPAATSLATATETDDRDARLGSAPSELEQLERAGLYSARGEPPGATLLGKCKTFLQSKRQHSKSHKRPNTAAPGPSCPPRQQPAAMRARDSACTLGASKSAENIMHPSGSSSSGVFAAEALATPLRPAMSEASGGQRCSRLARQQRQRQQHQRQHQRGSTVRELSAGAEVGAAVALSDYNDLGEGDDDDDFERDNHEGAGDDLLEFGATLVDMNCINSLMRERQAACSPCTPGAADREGARGAKSSGYLGFHEKLDLHNRRLAADKTRHKKGKGARQGGRGTPPAAAGASGGDQQQQVNAGRSTFGWLAASAGAANNSSSNHKQAFLAKSPRHSSSTNSSSGSRSSRALNLTRSMTGEIFDSFLRAASLRSVASGKANL